MGRCVATCAIHLITMNRELEWWCSGGCFRSAFGWVPCSMTGTPTTLGASSCCCGGMYVHTTPSSSLVHMYHTQTAGQHVYVLPGSCAVGGVLYRHVSAQGRAACVHQPHIEAAEWAEVCGGVGAATMCNVRLQQTVVAAGRSGSRCLGRSSSPALVGGR